MGITDTLCICCAGARNKQILHPYNSILIHSCRIQKNLDLKIIDVLVYTSLNWPKPTARRPLCQSN